MQLTKVSINLSRYLEPEDSYKSFMEYSHASPCIKTAVATQWFQYISIQSVAPLVLDRFKLLK